MTQTRPDLAVIIVTWNVRELVLHALGSLYQDLHDSGLSAEVIVVDNASADGTPQAIAEFFPQTKLIASRQNLGFGAGNNMGLREAGFGTDRAPNAAYLLNADTITQPGATETLYKGLMSLSNAGLVGAHLTYGDGSFQHSAFGFPGLRQLWVEFFPTPGRLIEGRFNGRYARGLYQHKQPFEVDFVLGATMMLKREVIERTQGFDETFFMYCEEIDWAWRVRQAGYKVYCVPAAHVVHLGGQSTGQVRARSVVDLWTSRMELSRKHYPAWKQTLARRMIARGMALKAQQTSDAELREAYLTIREMALNGS